MKSKQTKYFLLFMTIFCLAFSFHNPRGEKDIIGNYEIHMLANMSGGMKSFLTIKKNGKYKIKTPLNHFSDGSTEFGTWTIKNDSLLLNCDSSSSRKKCDRNLKIKRNKLCWTQFSGEKKIENCFEKK